MTRRYHLDSVGSPFILHYGGGFLRSLGFSGTSGGVGPAGTSPTPTPNPTPTLPPGIIDIPAQVRGSMFVVYFTELARAGFLVDFNDADEVWLTAKLNYEINAAGTPTPDPGVFQKTKSDGAIVPAGCGGLTITVQPEDTLGLPNVLSVLNYDLKVLFSGGDGPWTLVVGTLLIWPNRTVASS